MITLAAISRLTMQQISAGGARLPNKLSSPWQINKDRFWKFSVSEIAQGVQQNTLTVFCRLWSVVKEMNCSHDNLGLHLWVTV